MIDWRAESGDVTLLFQAMERRKARSFLDELRLKNVDLLAGVSADERRRLHDQEIELRRQLSVVERQLNELPTLGKSPSSEAVAQRQKVVSQVFLAREALYQHLADVRSASPAYRELLTAKTQVATLEAAQALLAADELLLSYSIGAEHSYVLVIRSNSASFQPLVLDEATARQLALKRGPVTTETLTMLLLEKNTGVLPSLSSPNGSQEASNHRLAALWQLLIPESERAALVSGNVKLLMIRPDGPLAMLPFETLLVANESEPQYLLDVGPPISYAPSAAVLLNLSQRNAPELVAAPRMLTLGDPAYSRGSDPMPDAIDRQLGLSRSVEHLRVGMTRLPYSGLESNWVEQWFTKAGMSVTKLIGPSATEAGVRQNATGRQIIHLACHGMADQSYGNFFGALAVAPGRSGDPTDDGFLNTSEISELDLTGCELAILSACETNYGPLQQGEGVWALSRGFLVAGSRRVVASNWVVDDEAGATLVSYFAGSLTKTSQDKAVRNYAMALHNAKKQVRQDEKWQHPFYWSSLVLVGPK